MVNYAEFLLIKHMMEFEQDLQRLFNSLSEKDKDKSNISDSILSAMDRHKNRFNFLESFLRNIIDNKT